MATLRLPPGPKGRFLLGHLLEVKRDPLTFLQKSAEAYGDLVLLRLGPRPVYLVNHPELIEYVLVKGSRNFTIGPILRSNRLLLGDGMLVSQGDFWLRQRRMAQPAFHRERVLSYAGIMLCFTERMLSRWQDGLVVDMHQEMISLAMEIVTKALFGADIAGDARSVGDVFNVVVEHFNARAKTGFLIPETLPTPGNLRLRAAVKRLNQTLYGMIRERRASGASANDLLSILLEVRDEEDGSQMTEQQVRDEVMSMFLAGLETTANAMTWTTYLLSQHPEVEKVLVEELTRVLSGKSPTLADLPNLRYTEMVLLESMRLYPPVYALGREAIQDCHLGEWPIPKGATLLLSQWVVHRSARYFDQSEAFCPERWNDDLAKRIPPYAYFPFGGGPRICIGKPFAMMEMLLVIATVFQRYRFTLAPGFRVQPQATITLQPKDGVRMVMNIRH